MLSGLTSSFYLDTPPGATITLVFIALFLIVNIIKRILVAFRRKITNYKEKKPYKTKNFYRLLFILINTELFSYFS